jgi:hypothetical protein
MYARIVTLSLRAVDRAPDVLRDACCGLVGLSSHDLLRGRGCCLARLAY